MLFVECLNTRLCVEQCLPVAIDEQSLPLPTGSLFVCMNCLCSHISCFQSSYYTVNKPAVNIEHRCCCLLLWGRTAFFLCWASKQFWIVAFSINNAHMYVPCFFCYSYCGFSQCMCIFRWEVSLGGCGWVCVCVRATCNSTLRFCGRFPVQSSDLNPFQAITKICSPVSLGTECKRFFFFFSFSCMHLCIKGNVFVCAYVRGLTCLAQSHALWSEWLVFFFCRPRKCVYCSHAMKLRVPCSRQGALAASALSSDPGSTGMLEKRFMIPRCL